MQQLYQLDCDWTDDGYKFIHHGTNIFLKSIDIAMNVTHLKTISNIWTAAHSNATIPMKMTGKGTAKIACIFQVEIDEILGIQQPTVNHVANCSFKGKVEPGQVPLSLINLLHEAIQIAKHTIIGSLIIRNKNISSLHHSDIGHTKLLTININKEIIFLLHKKLMLYP